ncbi:MAG TPA: hypothetical protein VFB06_00450 [Streptosporangiaceae bacterium]|nr:hypothetical protein [Streptosporangiaceae bacterium]
MPASRSSSWRAPARRAPSRLRGLRFCSASSCACAASAAISVTTSAATGSASSSQANSSSHAGSSARSSDGAAVWVQARSRASASSTSLTAPIRVQHGSAASIWAAWPSASGRPRAPDGTVSTAWPLSVPAASAGPAARTRTGPPGRSLSHATATGAPHP